MARIASQAQNFPQWYLDVIDQAGLSDYADVKGCIIFKPYGFALWEAIQKELDPQIKALGVQNCYFPLFIPESYMAKEKDHVAGFAPECAVVTHGGGKELAEKLYIRPTSETIIYASFAKWVHSHRDLPIKVNQWVNMVRWEMRPRPFLRTTEFLWHEGHTAHATMEEADALVESVLTMYREFDKSFLALPVLTGKKPDHEKFAGAFYTLTTEALARDGKAIQAGTSHNLGQGFSEAFDVSFLDEAGKSQRPWMTSWAVSTRLIGTLIVVHGDEKGLRLPPTIAPIQIVIVPIYKTDTERESVLTVANALSASLNGLRVRIDDRDEHSPGFKFNEWELKGVPLRIEIGPKDLEKKQYTIARRDTGEKSAIDNGQLTMKKAEELLREIQDNLYNQALTFMKDHTHEVDSFDAFAKIIEDDGGFVWAPWDGVVETAKQIQEKTKASIRLLGDATKANGKKDILSGAPAKEWALYAKAY